MNSSVLYSMIPDPEAVLAMQPEELAGYVLEWFNSVPNTQLNRYNFGLEYSVQGYPAAYHRRMSMALMEAWVWLEGHSFIAPSPGTANREGDWYFITRRGQQIKKAADLEGYRRTHGIC